MTPSSNRAFIDLNTGAVRASTTGTIVPRLAGILGTQLSLVVSFFRDSVPTALPDGALGRFVLKSKLSHGSPALVLDTAWTVLGDGPARTYKFDALLDSQALRAKLEGKDSDFFAAQIEWNLPSETNPSKSLPFDVLVFNAYSRDGDEAPDPIASASWEWLKDRAPQSGGFTHNDTDRTLGVSASAGAPGEDGASAYEIAVQNGFVGDVSAWLASLVGAVGQPGEPGADGPLVIWKGAWNGGTYEQNDAVSYAGSSWLALRSNSGVAPTEGADWTLIAAKGTDGSNGANGVFSEIASQAEAEAGTETTKGMTPERVAQAIAALANGGSSINWLGEWQAYTTYAEDDAVSYSGSSWISLLNGNSNNAPFEGSSYWGLLARAGTNGMDGQPGAPGTNGTNGVDGTNATPITSVSDDGNGNLTIYTQNSSYGPFALKGPQGVPGMDGPPGSGDVNGPGSCTDGNIATFSGTSGKLIQDSGVGISGGDLYVSGVKVLGAQQAGVASASENHSVSGIDTVDYNALMNALNDLGMKFNALKSALEAHGLINTV